MRYLHDEETMRRLIDPVSRSDSPDRERIAELLREGRVATALGDAVVSAATVFANHLP